MRKKRPETRQKKPTTSRQVNKKNPKYINEKQRIRIQERNLKNMKKKRRRKIIKRTLLLILLIFTIIFVGYKLINHFFFTYKFTAVPNIRLASDDNLTQEVIISDTNNRELTVAEKKSDFNNAYELMVSNYPRTNENQEKYDNFISKKIEYEDKILETTNDAEFLKILNEYFDILDDPKTGILSLSSFEYEKTLMGKEFYEEDSPYNKLLSDERINDRYNKLASSEEAIDYSNSGLETEIISQNIAVIRIKNFSLTSKEGDYQKIVTFLKSLDTQNNLIIDIRGASGNSDSYWVSNLITPISRSTYQANATLLFSNNSGDDFMDYLSIGESIGYFDLSDERVNLASLPSINKEEYPTMNYAKQISFTVSSDNAGEYNKNVYILQDENTSMAADTFAYFAQNSNFAIVCGRSSSGTGVDIKPFMFKLDHSGFILSIDPTITLDTNYENYNINGNIPGYSLEEPLYENIIKKIENSEIVYSR